MQLALHPVSHRDRDTPLFRDHVMRCFKFVAQQPAAREAVVTIAVRLAQDSDNRTRGEACKLIAKIWFNSDKTDKARLPKDDSPFGSPSELLLLLCRSCIAPCNTVLPSADADESPRYLQLLLTLCPTHPSLVTDMIALYARASPAAKRYMAKEDMNIRFVLPRNASDRVSSAVVVAAAQAATPATSLYVSCIINDYCKHHVVSELAINAVMAAALTVQDPRMMVPIMHSPYVKPAVRERWLPCIVNATDDGCTGTGFSDVKEVLSKLLPPAATGRWHEVSQLLVMLHAAVGGDGMYVTPWDTQAKGSGNRTKSAIKILLSRCVVALMRHMSRRCRTA
jgi:hypothetical protein